MNLQLAITMPHCKLLHGGPTVHPGFITLYSYTLDEFYDGDWLDDMDYDSTPPSTKMRLEQFKKKGLWAMNLVRQYRSADGVDLSVLYTYRLNLFKRIWRNKHRTLV